MWAFILFSNVAATLAAAMAFCSSQSGPSLKALSQIKSTLIVAPLFNAVQAVPVAEELIKWMAKVRDHTLRPCFGDNMWLMAVQGYSHSCYMFSVYTLHIDRQCTITCRKVVAAINKVAKQEVAAPVTSDFMTM